MKLFRRLIPLLIIALLVSACSAPAATPAPQAEAPAETSTEKVIGLAMPEIKGSFWTAIYYGVSEEAKTLGYKLIAVEAGGFQNVDKQISQIEDLIQRKVDILIVGATSAEGVAPVVGDAINAGIPVIGVSSIPKVDNLLAKVGADHYGMGVLGAQCLAEAIGETGEVVIAAGPSGVTWAVERVKGLKDTFAKDYPNIVVAAELNGPNGRDQGVTITEDWIQKFPDLKGIFAVVDDTGAGAADSLAAAGKTDDVVVSTCNLSPIGKEYLLSGKIKCETIQQIVLQGRITVQVSDAYFKGESFEENHVTPVILVTKENLETLDMSQFQAPDGYTPDLTN